MGGLTVAGISGIWAKSHRQPYYVTDEDVAEQAAQIAAGWAARPPPDARLPDRPGGSDAERPDTAASAAFLLANQVVAPKIHLCGHLHLAQERTLQDGRRVLNVGPSSEGSVVLIDVIGMSNPLLVLFALTSPDRGLKQRRPTESTTIQSSRRPPGLPRPMPSS